MIDALEQVAKREREHAADWERLAGLAGDAMRVARDDAAAFELERDELLDLLLER